MRWSGTHACPQRENARDDNPARRIARSVCCALLAVGNCLSLFINLVAAPELAAAQTAPLAAGESFSWAYLRLLASLALVIGVMLILYALVKKRFSLLHNGGDNHIRVIETRPVAPRKSLCLVEVSGDKFLLGLSQDGISLLAALGRRHGQTGDAPESQSFDSILKTSQSVSQVAEQP